MSTTLFVSPKLEAKPIRSSKTIIARFIARRTVASALIWGLIFGAYFASKLLTIAHTYPTAAAIQKVGELYRYNIGIELLLGRLPGDGTAAAFISWNSLSLMVTIGAIWALLLSSKYFRGEEDAGRWEVLLSGQTTPQGASVNTFVGLATSLGVFYIVLAISCILAGNVSGADVTVSALLFFALAVVAGITIFLTFGALASQLMPTRGRAASLTAAILGICFVLRATGDITSAHWLLDITPLGWIEKLEPLSSSAPFWLLPIFGVIIVSGALTIFFSASRDLGTSILADSATSKNHTRLLNSALGAAFRLTRMNIFGWLIAIFLSATFYGLITKSAVAGFSQSPTTANILSRLAHQSQAMGATTYLGFVFFLQMVLIMAYSANGIAVIRRDEADGYLDNFVVGIVSRVRWLSGRTLIITVVILLAGLLTIVGVSIGILGEHVGITMSTLLLASINSLIPGAFVVGAGIFALGVRPRLTGTVVYGILIWSFLIEMLNSGISINHWILDTSILNHIVFAPAANPRWSTDYIIILIASILGTLGTLAFNRRDLESQ